MRWLAGRCCQAYHDGFVEPLAHNPRAAIMDLVAEDGASSRGRDQATCDELPLASSAA